MVKGSDIASRAAASLSRTKAPKQAVPPRSKFVRLSAEVPPATYENLDELCMKLRKPVGKIRVTRTDVIRALITMAVEDPELQSRLAEQIREDQ